MIKVYDPTEREFKNNGLKILHPTKADVYKADNGDFYLNIEDSIENLPYYQQGFIIRVDTPWGEQGFRCNNPNIKNKTIICKAWHLFYDSARYTIADSNVVDKNCNDALDQLNNKTDNKSPFKTISDVMTISNFRCVRKTLEEAVSIILERWGGHLVRDNFNIEIRNNIGQNRGVSLRYGKNITGNNVSENWDDVCTKILPYTSDGDVAITLDELYLEIPDKLYDIPYTKIVEFENSLNKDDYQNEDEYKNAIKENLRLQALTYLEENKLPKVNYSISAELQNISDVGDTIYVSHPKCNIEITTQVISITYDCILKKYKNIEFGNFKKTLSNLLSETSKQAETIAESVVNDNNNIISKELNDATNKIWNVLGESYVIDEGNKILIVDKLPKQSAKNVIMFSSAGIGFSSTGINGIFNSAWTIDGTLNMQNINVINLVADMIKGGTLKIGSVENQSGILELYDESNTLIGRLDKTGLVMYAKDGSYVKLNPIDGFCGFDKNNEQTFGVDGDVFWMNKSKCKSIEIDEKVKFVGVDNGINKGVGIVGMV